MCLGDGVALFQSPLLVAATTLFKNAVVDDDVSVPNEKSPEFWTLDQMSGNFNPLSLTSFIKVYITQYAPSSEFLNMKMNCSNLLNTHVDIHTFNSI